MAALATQGHDQLGLEKLQLFPKLWSLPWDQSFSKTNLALERQNLIDFQVQIQKGNDSCLFHSRSKDAASMFLRCPKLLVKSLKPLVFITVKSTLKFQPCCLF